jgi:multidrug efflux pump subunit AcrB
LEQSELVFGAVERTIKRIIPPSEIQLMRDNIGLAGGGVALATGDLSIIGPSDGQILVSLTERRIRSTTDDQRVVLDTLQREFPEEQFWYQPADIVTQVLNQGLAAPIDVQIVGRQADSNYALARLLASEIRRVPGAADVRIGQVVDEPEIYFTVNRDRAQQMGLTQQSIAQSLLVSLSGSFQSAPNFWLDPTNGVNYTIFVQTPQYKLRSLDDLAQTPVTAGTTTGPPVVPELFANLATTARRTVPAVVNHYNIQQAFDVYAQPDGRDLGGVADDIDRLVSQITPKLPRGSGARPGAEHAELVQGIDRRDRGGAGPGVHHPHGQLPDRARPAGHHHRAARCGGRRTLGPLRHAHDIQRAIVNGNDHGAWRGHLE